MRVTSKGQITIPQDVREKAGILPGTEVDVIYDADGVRIVKAAANGKRNTRGQDLVDRLWGSATANLDMTTDEIVALMRGDDPDDPGRL